jgi:hypothetical protein
MSIPLRLIHITDDRHTVSFWKNLDDSAVTQKETDADLAKLVDQKIALTKPSPDAEFLMASSGRPVLDTADGLAAVGDVWEVLGKVAVRIGDAEDFMLGRVDEFGVGYEFRSSGNYLYLDLADFKGDLPAITLIKEIKGVSIVDGLLTVDPALQSKTYTSIDLKWEPHHSIAFDAATYGEDTSVGTGLTFTHTSSGSNPAFAAGLTWDTNTASASGSYDSVALTNKVLDGSDPYSSVLTKVPSNT